MWACHLGLQAIVMPPPRIKAPNYARVLQQLCSRIVGQQQVWVRIPVSLLPLDGRDSRLEQQQQPPSPPLSHLRQQHDDGNVDGWTAWDSLRYVVYYVWVM